MISVFLSQPDDLVLISLTLKKLNTYQTSHQRRILSAVIHIVFTTEHCEIVEFSMSAE